MEFRVLGPLEVTSEDGTVPLGGPKQRLVLAHLLLRANSVVATERLIDDIWGEVPPVAARSSLQAYVSRLRRALGPERIEARPPGYVFRADPEEVDALRFEEIASRARRVLPTDSAEAAALLDRALRLWRGSPLADIADTALRPEITRLEQLRLGAIEDRVEAELALGRHADPIPELESLLSEHPLRERMWGQLMLALYRSGRQAESLAAYQRARRILGEELGIDPSPELRRLHEQVLKQDAGLELKGRPLRGYQLLDQIGEGAFGAVYRALQPQVGREVAIKIIHPRLANNPDYIRRFEQEAQLVARLEHPCIVPLYDYWREPDGAFLAMRFLRGGNLRDALAAGPLAPDRVIRVIDQVALALAVAHRQGVVHRDVRPANILFDEEGNAYLSDFGIAKDVATAGSLDAVSTGLVSYISPEEIAGRPVTPAADLYSLGLVLFEILAARHPFAGTPAAELVDTHVSRPVPSILAVRPELPAQIDELIQRATAKDPTDRHRDVLTLAGAVRSTLEDVRAKPARPVVVDVRNPYKGLRPFREADAPDFFGREVVVAQLVARMNEPVEGGRFLAVVGPSGSGKSSVVGAGLVPALRQGALPGSERWFVVEMVPGAYPFEELEAALVRIAANPAPGLTEQLAHDEHGLLRAVRWILPADGSQLLLVIDQFEELFALVADEAMRSRFLAALVAAVADPRSRIRVLVTLRADFYDRPLLHKRFGDLLARRTHAITPLSPGELERAIAGPAERSGVTIPSSLMAQMVAEVSNQPAALPLLQYALTELFERRIDSRVTLEAHERIGGIQGAVARTAEELYASMDAPGKEACRQLFLRLVTVGEDGSEDTRRRVLRTELTSVEVDPIVMERTIEILGAARLVSFDRDPATRGPTVELAHEALIRVWARLRDWIDEGREDVRTHRRLAAGAEEWEGSGREPSFLLTGTRLDRAAAWVSGTRLALGRRERDFVRESLRRHEAEIEAEAARLEHERSLERRSVRRTRALIAAVVAGAVVAATLTAIAVQRGDEARSRGELETAVRLTAAAVASLDADPRTSLRLALHAVASLTRGQMVPAATVEALHLALQEARVPYPVPDGPVAVVAGPFGQRGVFDLPFAEMLALASAHAAPRLTDAQCRRYFGDAGCPSIPMAFSADLRAESIRAQDQAGPARPLAGTRVELGVFDAPSQVDLDAAMQPFTARTGIDVRLVELSPLTSVEDIAPGDLPDLGIIWPGAVADLAARETLVDLGVYMDIERLKRDQSPYLVSLGTVGPDGSWPSEGGRTYGVIKSVAVKSLIWYPAPELHEAGYAVPRTWTAMIDLSDRLVADGRTPWCLGWRAGPADGFPGTDWIENLVLAEAGPAAYDRWAFHAIPFDSAPVRRAFDRLGRILFADGYLYRGTEAEDSHELAHTPMVDRNPPRCWLYRYPSYGPILPTWGSLGTETDVFPFPVLTERHRDVLLGGGDMMAAFADRPEVREVLEFVLSPEFGTAWAGRGTEFMSPNRRFGPENYPPFWRPTVEALRAALAADTFRFDASDLMPPEIGQQPFWNAMITYLDEGPESLDRILAELDAAWPDDG